jgi:hypothetical protein
MKAQRREVSKTENMPYFEHAAREREERNQNERSFFG